MAQDSKMGLGDKLKQKLHLGTSTHTSSHKTSSQSSSSSTMPSNSMGGFAPLAAAAAAPAPVPLGVQYENPVLGVHDVGGRGDQPGQNVTPEMAGIYQSGGQQQGKTGKSNGEDTSFVMPGNQAGEGLHYTLGDGGVTGKKYTAQPKTSEKELPRSQHPVSPELSSQLATSGNAPGGPAGGSATPGSAGSHKDFATSKAIATGEGGPGLSTEATEMKSGPKLGDGPPLGKAGVNDDELGKQAHPGLTSTESAPQGPIAQAQEMVQPVIEKLKETGQPVVEKVKAAGSVVAEQAQPAIQQVKESSQPLLGSAADTAQRIGEVGRQKVARVYNAAAEEMDRHGVNRDTSQQKMADLGQAMKDYSMVGQERAGEYLQQAVDKACAIGNDGDNQNMILKVLGTIALIWLAFGFSLTALIALGIAAVIAALLSRYTRRSIGTQGTQPTHNFQGPGYASRTGRGSIHENKEPSTIAPSTTATEARAHEHGA